MTFVCKPTNLAQPLSTNDGPRIVSLPFWENKAPLGTRPIPSSQRTLERVIARLHEPIKS
jgi:hypothetical protein